MGGKACYKRVYKELGDLMGQVYGMNLVDEKKYVGYTERGVIRIIEHLKCYNPYSLGKRQCAFFIPAIICKSGKRKGKKIYGRMGFGCQCYFTQSVSRSTSKIVTWYPFFCKNKALEIPCMPAPIIPTLRLFSI